MRISSILYDLYLIFLRGGRLNQQRLSSGQSASRKRVLHPLPLSLSHSSQCSISLWFFVILNQIPVCVSISYIYLCQVNNYHILESECVFFFPNQPIIPKSLHKINTLKPGNLHDHCWFWAASLGSYSHSFRYGIVSVMQHLLHFTEQILSWGSEDTPVSDAQHREDHSELMMVNKIFIPSKFQTEGMSWSSVSMA